MITIYYLLKITLLTVILLQITASHEKLQPNIPTEILQRIYFLFHRGPTVNDFTKIPYVDTLSISEISEFDSNKVTVFYMPGWTETPSENEESVDTIIKAFLSKNSANLVVIDYSALVKGDGIYNYFRAVRNISDIGQSLGYFLKNYIPKIQPAEKVHLIGHSLGSQIMSKTAIAYGKGQLKWLTALDPAGPLFNIPMIDHLSKEDAEFVDVIHTDGWGYGDGRSIGHVDFYPNLGVRIQPYCNTNPYEFCSHQMSWKYYAESILNETIFPAKKCSLNFYCTRYNMNWCCNKDASIAYMGYGVDKKSRGNFYLKTDKKTPFSLGEKGFYI